MGLIMLLHLLAVERYLGSETPKEHFVNFTFLEAGPALVDRAQQRRKRKKYTMKEG